MNGIEQLLLNPLLWKILISYWVFNSLVAALPAPNGNKFYQFLYGFLHALGGNVDRAANSLKMLGSQPPAPPQP